MARLICDFQDHKGEVKVDADAFAKVKKAVEDHVGAPVMSLFTLTDQTKPNWHITPNGPDWHIGPTG